MDRVRGIDFVRVISAFAVILLHTEPFRTEPTRLSNSLDRPTVIDQAARFAVPLFLLSSGYFWGKRVDSADHILSQTLPIARRVACIFATWSIIYLLPWDLYGAFQHGITGPVKIVYWNIHSNLRHPALLLMEGTKIHLWFLVSLLCSLLISALMIQLKLRRLLIALALIFYATGLAGKAYSDTPLGFHIDFNFRDGPFFSLIFFVIGYLLQRRRRPNQSWFAVGLSLAAFGATIQLGELLFLNRHWQTSMVQDYVAGTYLFGVGVAMMALSDASLFDVSRITSIGPLVLGVYTSHMLFVDLLKPIDRAVGGAIAWEISQPIVVFLSAYWLAKTLPKYALTRGLVT